MPTDFPTPVDPWADSGSAQNTEPPAGLKTVGFVGAQHPPSNFLNWILGKLATYTSTLNAVLPTYFVRALDNIAQTITGIKTFSSVIVSTVAGVFLIVGSVGRIRFHGVDASFGSVLMIGVNCDPKSYQSSSGKLLGINEPGGDGEGNSSITYPLGVFVAANSVMLIRFNVFQITTQLVSVSTADGGWTDGADIQLTTRFLFGKNAGTPTSQIHDGTALRNVANTDGDETITGIKTFSSAVVSSVVGTFLKVGHATLPRIHFNAEGNILTLGINCDPAFFNPNVPKITSGYPTGVFDIASGVMVFRWNTEGQYSLFECYTAPDGWVYGNDITLIKRVSTGLALGVPIFKYHDGTAERNVATEDYAKTKHQTFVCASPIYGGTGNDYEDFTWVHPGGGPVYLSATWCGGGGGGGGGAGVMAGPPPGGGGGGGGGSAAIRKLVLPVSGNVTVRVGKGGGGGAAETTGRNGGESKVGALIAENGFGGVGTTTATGAAGGVGGAGHISQYAGIDGGAGANEGAGVGGDGGVGARGHYSIAAAGGVGDSGSGNPGINSSGYHGGGGGGGAGAGVGTGGVGGVGGSGTPGFVIVEW